ncbi:MAG: lipocalin family protein [Bacteroidales bacterium]|jgi:hypothetical protein|nr:lipocalin family protein [Bacteroidales bacterium]
MKNKAIVLTSLFLLAFLYVVYSCSEIEDNDIITGKWIEKEIVNSTQTTECQKRSYIEFSQYNLEKKDRKVYQYYACTETGTNEAGEEIIVKFPRLEEVANYTIKDDTLTLVDTYQTTTIYVIKSITKEAMLLSTMDRNGDSIDVPYIRFE